jgi:2-polyprenyl-3-methyl-5-hydroxy-6-metoxy-1,4-benzoquinol methylase
MIMSESIRKDFPDWETLYESQRVETMPWYNENFDFDLEKELDERKIVNNNDVKKFLDLGTGPATQAIWLAKRGFKVIGSDLSGDTIHLRTVRTPGLLVISLTLCRCLQKRM